MTMETRSGPSRVERYNLYPAAAIDGDSSPGFQFGPVAYATMGSVADRGAA